MIIGCAFPGRNARRPATAAGIWTDLKCGVSEVERSLRDMVVLHG